MSELLNTFLSKNTRIPIWFMRQAGRYMPEYMSIRSRVANFLDLCYDSQKVCRITMQPVDRFDLDAAILFSDILVLPQALGWEVSFTKGHGPILKRFENRHDLALLANNFSGQINNVYEAIILIKNNLRGNTSLIGFAGSPWTVMSYMLEGQRTQDFVTSKNFLYENAELAKDLAKIITDKTIEHLTNQIIAGVDVIQLFDSWAGVLNGELYEEFIIEPTKRIVSSLKTKFPLVPIIGFPKGSGFNYDQYIAKTKIDAIGVDQFVPVYKMQEWQKKIVVQGNLDPVVLLGNKQHIRKHVDIIMNNMRRKNFIFNLGHGILPPTPVENVEFLVKYVKELQ